MRPVRVEVNKGLIEQAKAKAKSMRRAAGGALRRFGSVTHPEVVGQRDAAKRIDGKLDQYLTLAEVHNKGNLGDATGMLLRAESELAKMSEA